MMWGSIRFSRCCKVCLHADAALHTSIPQAASRLNSSRMSHEWKQTISHEGLYASSSLSSKKSYKFSTSEFRRPKIFLWHLLIMLRHRTEENGCSSNQWQDTDVSHTSITRDPSKTRMTYELCLQYDSSPYHTHSFAMQTITRRDI